MIFLFAGEGIYFSKYRSISLRYWRVFVVQLNVSLSRSKEIFCDDFAMPFPEYKRNNKSYFSAVELILRSECFILN